MIKSIGKIVRGFREKQGLTIAELAEKASVSDTYVSRLERDKINNPRVNQLNDLAEALGIKLPDLFTNDNLSDPYTIELLDYLGKLPERSELISPNQF